MQQENRIAGIIAEYNPFHRGHENQITLLKETYGFEGVVVCMSGEFTQRGEPAIAPALLRARAAVEAGADLVIRLPVLYAVSGAEYFAMGGVSLLNELGIVDTLAFGAELPDLSLLRRVADHVLALESKPGLAARLRALTRQGKTFPQARETLLMEDGCPEEELKLLRSPNSLLGVEYLKALRRLNSAIRPLPLPRTGSGHESLLIEEGVLPSAGAIREYCKTHSGDESGKTLASCLTPAGLALLPEKPWPGIDAFSDELRFLLTRSHGESFKEYLDVSAELGRRIEKLLPAFRTVSSFIDLLKTRELTRTRISRALLHILLDIPKEPFKALAARAFTPYAEVLAFRKDSPVLPLLRRSFLPRFTNPHSFRKKLTAEALQLLSLELRAERIFSLKES